MIYFIDFIINDFFLLLFLEDDLNVSLVISMSTGYDYMATVYYAMSITIHARIIYYIRLKSCHCIREIY